MTNFKITNPELFSQNVDSLLIDGNDVVINDRCITGEHGINDYEEEYGFILCAQEYVICDNTSNSYAIYIDESGDSCQLIENAEVFSSEEEAVERIEAAGWTEWAYVSELHDNEF